MVYVDDAEVHTRGFAWFHLMADSLQELHEFAASIGIPARAFHRGARHPHYDVTVSQRGRALQHGAVSISTRDAVRIGRQAATPRALEADALQLSLFA